MIYDEISPWGISAQRVADDLADISADHINVRINSPGGDVFDGVAIYNALKAHPATVTTVVDSVAASISSVILMAGDEIQMQENSMIMVHGPWSFAVGNAAEFRERAEMLDKIADSMIVPTYVNQTGQSEDDIREMLTTDTWLSAKDAKELGFADTILEDDENRTAALAHFDLSAFENAPEREAPTLPPADPSNLAASMQHRERQLRLLQARFSL